jgi:hypothetical protein
LNNTRTVFHSIYHLAPSITNSASTTLPTLEERADVKESTAIERRKITRANINRSNWSLGD